LRKVYKLEDRELVAVDSLSLGIKNGECFALLGVNGAGKTTSFKMICGELQPTSGQIYILGHDVQTSFSNIKQLIGYCP